MREPSGKPVLTGPSRSNAKDAEWALTKARRYIFRGGQWTPALRAYVDRWLDYMESLSSEVPADASSRHDATGGDTR